MYHPIPSLTVIYFFLGIYLFWFIAFVQSDCSHVTDRAWLVLQGVHAILAADPSLQDSMLDLLLPHFALFLQPHGPLLKLDACASLQVSALSQAHMYVVAKASINAHPWGETLCLWCECHAGARN